MPVAGGATGEREACKTEACAIQTCLSKSHYQADKCQEPIQALMRCCEKYQGKSVHCGWDPEGGEGSAAGQPKDQVFHGGSRSQKIK